jgi:uncharacterized membrane protein
MQFFAPFTTIDALHPLVIHFPIALLLIVPVFLVLMFFSKKGEEFRHSAFILMVIGTMFLYVAAFTGDAAKKVVDRTPEITKALNLHEELADTSQMIFTALTVLFFLGFYLPKFIKKQIKPKNQRIILLCFIVLYLAAAGVLAMTAHKGGILVHSLKVTASL